VGLRLHTHLAETIDEQHDCLARFGCRPVELMEDLGWIADDVWVAHAVHLDDTEVAGWAPPGPASPTARRATHGSGPGCAGSPTCSRPACPVGLGVDGVASNEVGGLFPELRQALYTARQRTMRADALLPDDVLRLATEGGAACLGRDDLGRLEPGQTGRPGGVAGEDLADVPNPIDGLVLGPDRRARSVLVGGDPVVRDGALVGTDHAANRRELARRARRLWPD
jgi:cytosine/adenosine deaminase-related metal-dependent hydrolase